MRLIGNILWHIPFLGFLNAFFVFFLGALLTLLVVTSPLGLGLIQYSKFLLAPFSYTLVSKNDLNLNQNVLWQSYSIIIIILYLPIGLIITIITLFQIVGLCVTIVGIPVALVLAKSLGVLFNPVGKVCVPQEVGNYLDYQKGQRRVDDYFRK